VAQAATAAEAEETVNVPAHLLLVVTWWQQLLKGAASAADACSARHCVVWAGA
jgi:hypothetical protein